MRRKIRPVVALDIGGTKFIAAVVGGEGQIVSRAYRQTLAHEGPKRVIARLCSAIGEVIDASGIRRSSFGGIGIAAAGLVDTARGLVTESPNLPSWNNVPLKDRLSSEFGMNSYIINDASAAALGEHAMGAGVGLSNLVFITVSTGIGGGIIIQGKLYEGTNGCAGEIGHMLIQTDGPVCSCGRRGCLEALASGTAIARMARERLAGGEKSILPAVAGRGKADLTAEMVWLAAKKGDSLACDIIDVAADYLGIGLGNLVNIFNPEMVVVGGGVSQMGEMILTPARRSMKRHAFRLPSRTVRVVRAKLRVDAGLLGAAVYARSEEGRQA
jgi:glucokinase